MTWAVHVAWMEEMRNTYNISDRRWRGTRGSCYFLFVIIVSGVRLSPLGTAATTGLLYQPQMIDEGDCGEIGGMKIGRGNRSTRRKPAPVPLCPPQIPHDQTQAWTRATAVGKPVTWLRFELSPSQIHVRSVTVRHVLVSTSGTREVSHDWNYTFCITSEA
jgi:hypothetical protein